jgi:hypothetical protein
MMAFVEQRRGTFSGLAQVLGYDCLAARRKAVSIQTCA